MADRWRLEGKRAVVTGGTKGIGRACVEDLLELGAHVIFVARDAVMVAEVASELSSKFPDRVTGLAVDVSIPASRIQLVNDVQAQWPHVDILVNNVGTNVRKATLDYSDDEISKIMSTNLDSVFHFCRLFHPLLKQSGAGSIVNISSVAGLTAMRTGSVYAMTKAALVQLTKNLACEWAKDGIRVNCVAPWYTNTPLAAGVLSQPAFLQEVLGRTPMKRIGEASEVSGAVAFLCMSASSFTTGQTLAVDGGFSSYGF